MLPSILAKQLQKGIGDYIATTFPMTNEPFKDSVEKMLANKGSVYHEPCYEIFASGAETEEFFYRLGIKDGLRLKSTVKSVLETMS